MLAEWKTRLTFDASAISRAWPIRPKPVTSVRAWTDHVGPDALVWAAERSSAGRVRTSVPTCVLATPSPVITSAAALFKVVIDFTAASIHSCLATPFLIAVEITPVPSALVNSKFIAGLRALIRQHALGMNYSRNRISEFCFFIADAVAADHRASGLDHLRQAAGKNALQNFEIAFIGKTDKRQRGQRLSPMA